MRRGGASAADPAENLAARVAALDAALGTGGAQLDPVESARARAVVAKVGERTALSLDHTVVALAGATGSGKSSLFNTLVGTDVSRIGARRPTTSKPTAAVWGAGDAGELLDWLQVDSRHLVGPGSEAGQAGDGPALDGLVLLDLPDFDSREVAHRIEAERILQLVDVFVWVTDPQKYADARLHDDFVRLLAQHEAVTLAVLNQADRLPPAAVEECAADLGRLLARDGISRATVLPTSVRTGEGVGELRRRIASAVEGHAAARRRLSADVVTTAAELRTGVADTEADADRLPRKNLDTALARAAGVPLVLDAVRRDYRRGALAHSGWLFTRWTGRLGRDPLRRLRVGEAPVSRAADELEDADVGAVLGRSSLPTPTGATRAAVDVAVRSFTRSAAEGLPGRWAEAVEDAATRDTEGLSDALDQAVLHTSLRFRRPGWWLVANVLQWILGLVAVLGALWLLGLYVLGLLALPEPETPTVGVVPVPTLMLIGGALLGMVFAGLARWWARVGARRRRAVVAGRLRKSIAEVTEARILAPIAAVLQRHGRTREHLDHARR
ncbi:GTPase family protein [Naasia sp. SYSU D00057]|uniref:GTPase family protein n=1 Tax=Naasia sp. SYSU D00057 TaxID=2817380 RepID=UPI001B305CEC|nr:GTPase [Naasia sp. SYSU D00057]